MPETTKPTMATPPARRRAASHISCQDGETPGGVPARPQADQGKGNLAVSLSTFSLTLPMTFSSPLALRTSMM